LSVKYIFTLSLALTQKHDACAALPRSASLGRRLFKGTAPRSIESWSGCGKTEAGRPQCLRSSSPPRQPGHRRCNLRSPSEAVRKGSCAGFPSRRFQREGLAPGGNVFSSHCAITCAISLLFFSSIIMWPLPRMPMSANLIQVGCTPACSRYLTVQ
jgi:hypothetical protein